MSMATIIASARRRQDCPPDWQLIDRGCVRLFADPRTMASAERLCKSYGGRVLPPGALTTNNGLVRFVRDALALDLAETWIDTLRDDNVATGQSGSRWFKVPKRLRNIDLDPDDCISVKIRRHRRPNKRTVYNTETSCETKLATTCHRFPCSRGSFHCSNELCITSGLTCNGQDDCGDRSDEIDCPAQCSQTIKVQGSGTYTFPDDATNAPVGNVDCILRLEAGVGSNIKLNVGSLNLEAGTEDLIVMDGGQTPDASRVVSQLSGSLASPLEFYSSNNMMILNTQSTRARFTGSFQVTYESVKVDVQPVNYLVASDRYQELSEPFSGDYELGNQDLTYVIQAQDPTKTITVEILEQDLASDSQVIFRDGATANDGVLTTLQGNYSGNGFVLSSSNVLYVTKQNLLGGLHKGMKLGYRQGCVMDVDVSTGFIKSPGFVSSYPNDVKCTYNLGGGGFSIKFGHMNLTGDDRLEIYDENNFYLKNYTAQSSPDPLQIPNGRFSAVFTASASETPSRFNASLYHDCPQPNLDLSTTTASPSVQTFYGSSFTVSCNSGSVFLQPEYQNLKQVQMECEARGRWNLDPVPRCVRGSL